MTTSNGFPFRQQPVGTDTHAFQVGKIEFNQVKASAIDRSVLSHLLGCSFGFVQVSRCANNLSTVRRQRAGRFHSKAGRNTRYQDAFALQIHA